MHQRCAGGVGCLLLHDGLPYAIAALGKRPRHLLECGIDLDGALITQALIGKPRQLSHLRLQRNAGRSQTFCHEANNDGNNRRNEKHPERQLPADRGHQHDRHHQLERILHECGQRLAGYGTDLLNVVGNFGCELGSGAAIEETHR